MILDKLFDWFGSGPTIYKGPVKNLKFKLKLPIFVKFSLESTLHCAVNTCQALDPGINASIFAYYIELSDGFMNYFQLFKSISMAIQKGNAQCVTGCVVNDRSTGLEGLFNFHVQEAEEL